jgi:hypothetical protein
LWFVTELKLAGIGQEKKLKPLLVTPKNIDSYVEITEQNFTTFMNGDGLHSFHLGRDIFTQFIP